MSSVQRLREFISEKLTAAAEEIFQEFEKTIVNYEEEIDRQRRLLDISWKPEIKLTRIHVAQQQVWKEEEVLCDQEEISSLDQEERHIKEEQQEVCSSQEGEQLVLKQETDAFMWTPTYQESDFAGAEATTEQLSSQNSPSAESRSQEQIIDQDSGSTPDGEISPNRGHRVRADGKTVEQSSLSHNQLETGSKRKSVMCGVRGKTFACKYYVDQHYRVHTGEKLHDCKICEKKFTLKSHLLRHMRIHTGEKPYGCKICAKRFGQNSHLLSHMRTHTGEKPFSCTICAKSFSQSNSLLLHMRTHTGDKLYDCKICGKKLAHKGTLVGHMRTHTGEKPFSCKICGKRFSKSSILSTHRKIHTIKDTVIF